MVFWDGIGMIGYSIPSDLIKEDSLSRTRHSLHYGARLMLRTLNAGVYRAPQKNGP